MNRYLVKCTMLLFLMVCGLSGKASGLVSKYSLFDSGNVCYPLDELGLVFNTYIETIENSEGFIYCGDSLVAIGRISHRNVTYGSDYGIIQITFNEPLYLPKGNHYTVVIPADVAHSLSDSSLTNDEYREDFYVPDSIGFSFAYPVIEESATVFSLDWYYVSLCEEAYPIDDSVIILYREEVPIRRFPCRVNWDMGVGRVQTSFGGRLNFEKDVRYRFTIPEGSVCSVWRDDIFNNEVSVNFFGGTEWTDDPIRHVGYDVNIDPETNTLISVFLRYDRSVLLTCEPLVRLMADGKELVAEVVPELTSEENEWVMGVKFPDVVLDSEKKYTLVIPESTLVTPVGNIIVNERSEISLTNSGDSPQLRKESVRISHSGGNLLVSGVSPGETVAIYSPDGKEIYKAKVITESITIPIMSKGLYLLTVNGASRKVVL